MIFFKNQYLKTFEPIQIFVEQNRFETVRKLKTQNFDFIYLFIQKAVSHPSLNLYPLSQTFRRRCRRRSAFKLVYK